MPKIYRMKNTLAAIILMLMSYSAEAQVAGFDTLMNVYNRQNNFSGVALLAVNGKVTDCKAVGLADRDNKAPVTVQSKFRIASMTKVFTAVMIMKLVEDGKIDLDKTIGYYYPAYSGSGRNTVTIHHLLTYSSGIENVAGSLGMQPYQTQLPLNDYISRYCSGKLIDAPGTKSNYANTEYIILHKIIELVSGKTYEDFLQQVILKPLNLTNTGIIKAGKNIKGLVKSYTYNDSLKTSNPDEDYLGEMFFGAGCLYSTVYDMLTFDQAIFTNKILRKETIDKMLHINENLGYTAYGLWGSTGWGNFTEKFYYRTGGILGSTSNWIHTISSGKTIIVLSNTDAVNLYQLSEKIYLLPKQ